MKTVTTATDRDLLLHICCAPDGTVPWAELEAEGYHVTGFFYGSNIHPREEYDLRELAVRKLAAEHGDRLLVETRRPSEWLEATDGFHSEPEGGRRCPICFRLQLEAAARAACRAGITNLCTTLTISPHKDPGLLNALGREVCRERGLVWVERVWRKNGGFVRSVQESRRLGLYRQDYCGCQFSIREMGNRHENEADNPADG